MFYALVIVVMLAVLVSTFFIKVEKIGETHRGEFTDKIRMRIRIFTLAVFTFATIGFSITIIQQGKVGFLKTFGKISHTTYGAGPHLVNPFSAKLTENILRRSIDYTGENTARGLTSNKVVMVIDVTIPWMINPSAAPTLRSVYGKSWNLIGPASRKAIRDCLSRLDWEDATSEGGRTKMSTCIPATTQKIVIADLEASGVPNIVAETAFTFPDALIRKMVPENQRILASIAEEQAAVVDLRRQETLTEIAEVEARRRANEGSGIKMMMEELPENFTVSEMVAMINANAAKASAEAFMKAVENGNPNITVITGGTTDGVPVSARAN